MLRKKPQGMGQKEIAKRKVLESTTLDRLETGNGKRLTRIMYSASRFET